MAGQDTDLQLEITRWGPAKRYGIKIINMQLPFESTEYVYRLEPENGGTGLILECESEWVSSY